MKKIICVILMLSSVPMVWAQEVVEEKVSKVHKIFDLPGVFARDGVLQESIGVETLAGIAAPVLKAGQSFPASAKMKFGISSDCQCAKFRLFRMPEDKSQPPIEISYDAVRGFSKDNKTLEVLFEITENRKVKLSVEVDQAIAPGQLLEWVPANEIVPLPEVEPKPEVAAPVAVQDKPAEATPSDALPVLGPAIDAATPSAASVESVPDTSSTADAWQWLDSRWVLKSGASELLRVETLRNVPDLEFKLDELVFMGQAPCNRYSGGLKIAENHVINFEAPAATRMACESLEAEMEYFKLLDRVDSCRQDGVDLVLVAGDLEVLRFKKAD